MDFQWLTKRQQYGTFVMAADAYMKCFDGQLYSIRDVVTVLRLLRAKRRRRRGDGGEENRERRWKMEEVWWGREGGIRLGGIGGNSPDLRVGTTKLT